jgi:hypothetical protein
MPYKIITTKNTYIQYTLFDFIEKNDVEIINCRTTSGRRRFRELFGRKHRSSGCLLGTAHKCFESTLEYFLYYSRYITYLIDLFNERDRRIFAGFLSIILGNQGVKIAAKLTGLDVKTVRRGKSELLNHEEFEKSRVRLPGGGKPPKEDTCPGFTETLEATIENSVAGDPMGGMKWTRKTLRWIKEKMQVAGFPGSISTFRKYLKKLGISMKKNIKSKTTQQHPDREKQFQHVNSVKADFLAKNAPVISIDTKKKELIGNFKNDGSTWCKEARRTLDHDFPSLADGRLIPFGVFDLKENRGHVYCGTSRETGEFAGDALLTWWQESGQETYPEAQELLILCDCGGANGYRSRLWKWELQTKMADQFGLAVHVCHYPPGTSKYNPIERKLFSFITKNWAGEPLTSYEKALGFISSTKTEKGLEVTAQLIDNEYQKGIKVSDEQMESLNISHHETCPRWNYILHPRINPLKASHVVKKGCPAN